MEQKVGICLQFSNPNQSGHPPLLSPPPFVSFPRSPTPTPLFLHRILIVDTNIQFTRVTDTATNTNAITRMPTSIHHHHHHHPLLRATLSFPTFPFAVLFRQTSSPIPLPNAFVKRWNKLVDNSQIPAPRLHRPRKLPLTNVLFIPPRHGSCTPHSANFITSSSSTRRSFFLPSKTFGLRSVQTLPSNRENTFTS